MRHILFVTLLLGSYFAVITAQSGVFEFTDSNGQCWRCAPGTPCERCFPQMRPRLPPANWPDTCPAPNCNDPANRGILFPSLTLRQYYQCDPDGSGGWVSNPIDCPCNTLFSFETQRCEIAWEFIPHCRFDISDPKFIDCDPTPATTTTTTMIPGETTTTTTTTDLTTTTPAPCVCVIWWPCWCNPCMSVPRPPSCMMRG